MSLPTCNPCAEVPLCWEDLEKYSLQDDLYGDVFICPPNVYCGGPQTMYLACCDGTTMVQNFPLGITIARRNQLIADLVAQCQRRLPFCEENPPPPPPPGGGGEDTEYFYSAPASCTVYCPDGTPFTYTVPAGVFIASSVAIAQEAARRLACLRAPLYRICLGNFNACWCVGSYSSGTISIESANPPFKVSQISGSFPAGVTLGVQGNQILIAGAPTTAGNYTFGLQVVDAFGNRTSRSYGMSVMSITTNSLPGYSVGVPYSYQLQASGGSGNYVWSLYSGTLPDGLTLSDSGLISGTPTGTGATVSLVFQVADRSCETNQTLIYVPHIKLTTTATTKIRVKRGYPVFTGGGNTLYKKITWTGSIIQRAVITQTGESIGGAKYIYSGYSEININGQFIAHHKKDLYVACNAPYYPDVAEGPSAELAVLSPGLFPGSQDRLSKLLGYCYEPDYAYCAECSTNELDWILRGDFATDSAYDPADEMLVLPSGFTHTPTTRHYAGTESGVFAITNISQWPVLSGYNSGSTRITAVGDYTATLSDPYTDADAIASEKTYTSALATAENRPDYQTGAGNSFLRFVYSRYTTVDFTLTAYNLVKGRTYQISYELVDGATTTAHTVDFVATGYVYAYTGTVPTPESGHSITIRKPLIRFV